MTLLILAFFIFLAVIFIAVGIELRHILDLEEKVRDLEMCRTQARNDIVFLSGIVRRLERNDT